MKRHLRLAIATAAAAVVLSVAGGGAAHAAFACETVAVRANGNIFPVTRTYVEAFRPRRACRRALRICERKLDDLRYRRSRPFRRARCEVVESGFIGGFGSAPGLGYAAPRERYDDDRFHDDRYDDDRYGGDAAHHGGGRYDEDRYGADRYDGSGRYDDDRHDEDRHDEDRHDEDRYDDDRFEAADPSDRYQEDRYQDDPYQDDPYARRGFDPNPIDGSFQGGACNFSACSQQYRSFRASDCSFQPFNGERRRCEL